ncbi:rod shape-determining protein MreC [Staphylococcus felis]|uniref:Cell shape-determining protein MreC n=1 Tax=Staphylococcus felis TaxID=46127 RepID=A0ABS0QPI5_9STAP|nr:rod shape-determining protein MreC [Staphylococcus felis]AVP37244.1 rod shape-determining protein MreC [Staphylococcus felis]MBH9580941.1 rod shape-determining protein MreC [Staphylococcus felis]MDM8328461.1 rod shape-determining protein MreC [Staphylococcus felis]MDQ7193969.1 rod shape-determining protein MreC [Staphylococcus felis]PNZ37543.1 rod shape-determining protein MreC [Staphylococcus felis]
MSNFFRNNKLVVLFCSIILFIALIGLSLRSNTQSVPEQYLGDTVSFGQRIFSYPIQFVSGSINQFFEHNQRPTNKEKQLEAENNRLKSENEKLKKELDMSDIAKYNPISAAVIARQPDQWLNTIVIDKGQKAGIKENMAVMTSDGLIGRVAKVNQFSSKVNLISTKGRTNRLSVNIQHDSDEVFGLIDHYDDEKNRLIISDIDDNDDVEKGDQVLTSGLGDQLPKGLYVGEVEKVQKDQYGLSKQVVIKTGANMNGLSHVYVAKNNVVYDEQKGESA